MWTIHVQVFQELIDAKDIKVNDVLLKADVDSYTLYSTRNADKKFEVYKKKINSRDRNTCHYCSFKASSHMQVINNDGDYLNNAMDNLVTACPFCAQCHFLPFVGKVETTGGVLIHLPDMTQCDLNALCHVLFCAISHETNYHKNADKIYKSLKLRSQAVEESWGKGLSSPSLFAQMLIDTPVEKVRIVTPALLKNVRLLPSFSDFRKEIDDWSDNALELGIT